MAFPDRLDAPARTVLTSEGGAGASRTTHVVRHADGRLRRLVPEELEVLNGFALGFTDIAGITPAKRGFLMGKALVTGLVTAIGRALWQAQTRKVGTLHAKPLQAVCLARRPAVRWVCQDCAAGEYQYARTGGPPTQCGRNPDGVG